MCWKFETFTPYNILSISGVKVFHKVQTKSRLVRVHMFTHNLCTHMYNLFPLSLYNDTYMAITFVIAIGLSPRNAEIFRKIGS